MKTNEAPEKIYLNKHPFTGELHDKWLQDKLDDSDIEYTCTDAVIKKVENFLEMLGYGFTITDNITHKNYDKEQLIEDFRKYIEEE